MPSYSLLASACPAVRVANDFLYPGAAEPAPVIARALVTGDKEALRQKFNENAVRLDLLGRYGSGGAYAVARGLDLSDGGGLTCTIGAGVACIDGHQEKSVAFSVALPDSIGAAARRYVWLLRNGSASVTTTTAAPANASAYLGSFRVQDGDILDAGVPDYSGRVELRGGILYRRTGDLAAPSDTPPAGIILWTETQAGLYLWDGDEWLSVEVDTKTVRTSGSHPTAGYLEDVLTAGSGITLTTVDVGGGIYKVRITSSVTGDQVKVGADDSAAGYLQDEITVGNLLRKSVAGAPSTDQSLLLESTYHEETFTVAAAVPVGEDAVVRLDWTAVGAFAKAYDVAVTHDQDPEGTLVSLLDHGKDGDGCYLLVTNGVDADAGSYGTSAQLQLTVTLRGFDWTDAGGSAVTATVTPFNAGSEGYDVACYTPGKPASSATLLRFVAVRAFSLPANWTGSKGDAGAAATAQTDFTVKRKPVGGVAATIGTVRFAAAGTTPTFILAAATDFEPGDVLSIHAPSSQDATLADVAITLAGVLS